MPAMNGTEDGKLKKYRVKISMVEPYEIVDLWPRKPDIDDSLEAFKEKLLTLNASRYFNVEVFEV